MTNLPSIDLKCKKRKKKKKKRTNNKQTKTGQPVEVDSNTCVL